MSTHNITTLKGIIFDLDGTLADTSLNFSKMCEDASLPAGTKILEYCAQLDDPNRVEEILSIVEKHELAGAKKATWILDAQDVLKNLREAEIPLAIVTRNMRKAAQLTIERLNIPIELVITREDCQPKPSPDGLLKVAKYWQINPAELAYVGDFQFDLIAAKRANMLACLIANQRNQHLHKEAEKVINSFKELYYLVGIHKR